MLKKTKKSFHIAHQRHESAGDILSFFDKNYQRLCLWSLRPQFLVPLIAEVNVVEGIEKKHLFFPSFPSSPKSMMAFFHGSTSDTFSPYGASNVQYTVRY